MDYNRFLSLNKQYKNNRLKTTLAVYKKNRNIIVEIAKKILYITLECCIKGV